MKFPLFSLLTFLMLIGIASQSEAQTLPDYHERGFIFSTDSLTAKGTMQSGFTATEGSVDPDQYYVGPGDRLFISVRGVMDQSNTFIINQEGMINIPSVGIVNLNNKTLTAAKNEIHRRILQVLKNVEVQISLMDYKWIKVSIIGNVKRPASYSVPGNSRLTDILMRSYGLQGSANLRDIKIISRNDEERHYDLLSFLRNAERKNNPFLNEGDIIVIKNVDKTVSVFGSVPYQGTYEFVENETVAHLIGLCGGFLDRAKTDSIEVVRFRDDNKNMRSYYYSYDELVSQNIMLNNGDKIIIREKPEYMPDRFVTVYGKVTYPGVFKVEKDKTTLKELLLNNAGGFLENASLKDAYVVRTIGMDAVDQEYERLRSIPRSEMTDEEYDYLKAKSRLHKGRMVIDFERLFNANDETENLILKRGDQIVVPEGKNYITVVGQVINAGNIIYKSDLTVDDYIDLAGGYGWRAVKGDVRVIKSNTKEWIEADDVDKLEPGDVIWVPEDTPAPKFWNIFTTSLTVLGQVATVVAAVIAVIVSAR